MTLRRTLRFLAGTIVAAGFLWLISRQSHWREVAQVIRAADLRWIAAAVLAFAVGYCCRIERWRLMLKSAGAHVTWAACAGPFLASFAANNVLPLRAGDLMRAFAFNDVFRTRSAVMLATLLVERLLDLLAVLLLLGIALLLFDAGAAELLSIASALAIAGAAIAMMALCYPGILSRAARCVALITGRIAPALTDRVLREVEVTVQAIGSLTRGRTALRLIAWSLAAWFAEGCVFWLTALALPSLQVPAAGWMALPVGSLATLIPSTPGYVGTFDYFVLQSMHRLGNSSNAATAYALLVHAVIWLPPTLAGGLYLIGRTYAPRSELAIREPSARPSRIE